MSSMDVSAATDSVASGSSALTSRRNCLYTSRAQLGVGPLGPEVGDLVIAFAWDHAESLARGEAGQEGEFRGAFARQPEPPHVEVHRVFACLQPGLTTSDRPPTIARHGQLGPQFTRALGSLVAHSGNLAALA